MCSQPGGGARAGQQDARIQPDHEADAEGRRQGQHGEFASRKQELPSSHSIFYLAAHNPLFHSIKLMTELGLRL